MTNLSTLSTLKQYLMDTAHAVAQVNQVTDQYAHTALNQQILNDKFAEQGIITTTEAFEMYMDAINDAANQHDFASVEATAQQAQHLQKVTAQYSTDVYFTVEDIDDEDNAEPLTNGDLLNYLNLS